MPTASSPASVSTIPETIRPALQIIRTRPGVDRVSGLYVMATNKNVYFFADTTVNIESTAEHLAETAILSAEVARWFNVEPRVAMLSFSNFGSTRHPLADKVRRATALVKLKARGPDRGGRNDGATRPSSRN